MSVKTLKILNGLDEAVRWSLYGLMASIPFSNALVSIFSASTIFFFFIHWLLRTWLKSSVEPQKAEAAGARLWPVLKWAILAYVAWNMVSVIGSIEFAQSLKAFFTKMLKNVVLFAAIIAHVRRKEHVLTLLGALLAGACVACLDGFVQWQMGTDLVRGQKVFIEKRGIQISGPFKHPNDFGGYLMVVGTFLIACLQAKFSFLQFLARKLGEERSRFFLKVRYPIVLIGLLFLVMACLGLTFSRAAWLAFGMGVVFFGCLNHRINAWLIAALVISALVFVPLFQQKQVRNFINLPEGELFFSKAFSPKYWKEVFDLSSSGRAQFWKDAWRIAADHPFNGSGINTYSEAIKRNPDALRGWYAHNCYLQMAAEIGFVGLGWFLSVFFAFYVFFMRRIKKVQDDQWRTLGLGLAAALFGFLVHCFFDTTMYSVQLGSMAWILMALSIAVLRIEARP